MKTTIEEARTLLSRAITEVPDLTYFGIGIYNQQKVHREKGMDVVKQEIARRQAEMQEHLDEIALCADWIKQLKPIKTIETRHNSYGHKHRVEEWIERQGQREYIANGSFIAAAVGLGFRYKIYPPNVCFNFSEKSLKHLRQSVAA